MTSPQDLTGRSIRAPRIFDGERWHEDATLDIEPGGRVGALRGGDARTVETDGTLTLEGGMLVPGFVDLQVNGGGGVLFNERTDVEGIATICRAHARYGTTALLTTLVTDTPEITRSALEAGAAAAREDVPGFLGLHLEGPHLSKARKGAHDPSLIRSMDEADLRALETAAATMPRLMTTVAAETVGPREIERLTAAGVHVSLGHSNASRGEAATAADSGAKLVTHLFNAMSPLAHREPGMVGHALDRGDVHTGLIADGVHVDPVAIGIALRAKRGPGRIFLVSDAMAPLGTDAETFEINGRTVYRRDGRLTLADGTLAGADIDMLSSVLFMHRRIGIPLEEALRMASSHPAAAIGMEGELGCLRAGARASFIHLDDDLAIRSVWIDGHRSGND
ncbi:N-acetylglucosamine-6-phosphate deacetylase [Pararhizobium mangrovi]|uniref:N-acetylglucosamine-6-phosphate deacetylase n=1 Tax=Pararhizobium mangrovi TaxID=2590452 RepID=A0A506UAH6_9HYPH|nr:N-acetylglucosamine-6-phosphate deacetylase [Pararhizobium mangrovi]TPW29589.1 N-acetylglucosamine-6-phosphate deacetylase [Pararhizobium mangrovi]